MGTILASLLSLFCLLCRVYGIPLQTPLPSCNTIDAGYQCFPEIAHRWGQYSPYYSIQTPSDISPAVPDGCHIIFAQVISRHGARFPTESKSKAYKNLIEDIQRNVTVLRGKYAFLQTYNYSLGADDLTEFGERQMLDSGIRFYERYKALTRRIVPFVRASGSDRVIASAEKFLRGFEKAKVEDPFADDTQHAPRVDVVLEESEMFNNTLDHGMCAAFERSDLGDEVMANFTQLFAPSIRERLQNDLPGAQLSISDVVSLMDMCPFDTVARTSDASVLSPFCALFTQREWIEYDYMQSLGKYYGYGAGNPLGPSQGIGFTNELIARLTGTPVHDETSTNHTLDSSPETFPLNARLYADFSHDNGMIPIYFALGLYNSTKPLSRSTVESTAEMDGYSAAWTVPFGARGYIEKMQCRGEREPLVRALVNNRVVPLHGCRVDKLGRCKLGDFVRGLSFARSGGEWARCSI